MVFGRAGFTLVELLSALVAVAVLALLLAQAMRGGTQFWVSASKRADALDESAAALRFVRDRLAMPYPAPDANLAPRGLVFRGTQDRLEWLTDLPASWADAGGFHRAKLEVSEGISGRQLTFSWAPWQKNAAAGSALSLGPLSDFRFRYWGEEGEGKNPRWQEQWLERDILPELIEVNLVRPGGEHQTIVVAPRVTVHSGCMLDAYSKRCRGQ